MILFIIFVSNNILMVYELGTYSFLIETTSYAAQLSRNHSKRWNELIIFHEL